MINTSCNVTLGFGLLSPRDLFAAFGAFSPVAISSDVLTISVGLGGAPGHRRVVDVGAVVVNDASVAERKDAVLFLAASFLCHRTFSCSYKK